MDRYFQVAKNCKAETIVRITADCPLIDPRVTDFVIEEYLRNQKDRVGASNIIERTYPRGLDVEVIGFATLRQCWQEAKEKEEREHVTLHIYRNPDKFKLLSIENQKDLSHLRWTVDEDSDFNFVQEIYRKLSKPKKIFFMEDVLELLEKEPTLNEINKNVKQKVLK